MLYGVSKSVVEHIFKGDPYSKIRKVYSVNIVYFDLGKGDDYVYHGFTNFKGLHTNNELELNYDEQQNFCDKTLPGDLYPEYYIIKVRGFDDVAKDTLDEWIYYLKHNKIKDEFTARGLNKAREVLLFDNLSDEEKREYWDSVEANRIKQSEIETALIKGRLEGREEGREEGEVIGIAKGETKWRTEEKTEIALKMLKKGMSIEDISDMTGLSKEQIEEL
jgi:predicted transposase/invertase (TIGR01784 family)